MSQSLDIYTMFKQKCYENIDKYSKDVDLNSCVDDMMKCVKDTYNEKYSQTHYFISDDQLLPLIIKTIADWFTSEGTCDVVADGKAYHEIERYANFVLHNKGVLTPKNPPSVEPLFLKENRKQINMNEIPRDISVVEFKDGLYLDEHGLIIGITQEGKLTCNEILDCSDQRRNLTPEEEEFVHKILGN